MAPKEPTDAQRAADAVAGHRQQLQQELLARIAEGKINTGELSPLVRELDFLRALLDVLND